MLQALSDLFYPPICLQCGAAIEKHPAILCDICLSLLELIDPEERCPACFSSHYSKETGKCGDCQKNSHIYQSAAAFEYTGPAATLVKRLKYSNQPYLAKGLAAYLIAQFVRLNWPKPDLVIPVPIAFTHLLERGYNQSLLLAKYFVEGIEGEMLEALERHSGDFSQAGLSKEQRSRLSHDHFHLKKRQPRMGLGEPDLLGKNILLLDDVMTTGSTLRQCASVLARKSPKAIYALTVCKAI